MVKRRPKSAGYNVFRCEPDSYEDQIGKNTNGRQNEQFSDRHTQPELGACAHTY